MDGRAAESDGSGEEVRAGSDGFQGKGDQSWGQSEL